MNLARLICLGLMLVGIGFTNPVEKTQTDHSKYQKASNEKLTRIRALFERLKAIQTRGRTTRDARVEPVQIPQNERDESEVVVEPKVVVEPRPSQVNSEFDQFLFTDDDSPEVPGQSSQTTPGSAAAPVLESPFETQIGKGAPELEYEQSPADEQPINEQSKTMRYVVQPGDALLLIARKLYRDPKKFKEIMAWNELKSVNLVPNQVLELRDVPLSVQEEYQQALAKEQESLFPPESFRYKVYKVGYGDSLARLASKFLGSQNQYLKLARLNEIDPDKVLYVGQKMIIPVRK